MDKSNEKIIETIKSADEVLKRVYFVLVREGYKRDVRGDVLYKPLGSGLELQYKIDISDMMESANVIVSEKLVDSNDELTREEVMSFARDNTIINYRPRLDTVSEILGIPEFGLPLYCLTNEKKCFGAGTILYPNMKEKIEKIIGDFIIIPSSVHEVLLMPDMGNAGDIKQIIDEVNSTIVADEDILSDRVYKLCKDGELIEV